MISFGTNYWFALLIAAIIAAAGIVLLLYFKNKDNRELTKNQVRILMGLRFLSFFLIAFLLLTPFLKNLKRIVQNPVVIAAWDNSGSVVAAGDSASVAATVEEIREAVNSELGNEYTLINYTFGQETGTEGALNFQDKKSDYSALISTISSNHFNDNIGAIIIAGDGIYNQGRNPVNMTEQLTSPVYTIGLGDTTVIADARIQDVRVNRTSFSGNKFPVEVDVRFSKLTGRPLNLSVYQDDTKLAETIVTPANNDFFYSHQFILDAGEPGLKHFTARIEVAENERNTSNNRSEFVVNVLENKQKILILSDGPHPDNGAVKNTLEEQKSYEASVFYEEPYPSNLTDFNLVILNQLPTSGKSMASLIEESQNRRVPLLFIVGNQTFIPQLNALSAGVEIEPLAGSAEETQAIINPAYGTFTLSENFREIIPKFPPLLSPFANYNLEPQFTTLLYQKINNIETSKPLIATGVFNGRKTGFIFGEGIWKWRLNNYYINQNHDQFNELINQLVQYLALRENEDNFMIDFQPVYAEIDDVILKAEVYNDAFERITSEEVNIEIVNEQGNEFRFTFDVQGDAYTLNAGKLPVGNYSFTSEVSIGNETFTETGNFTVTAVNLENIVTRANHRMLYQLASRSGGNFYLPEQTSQLIEEINNSNQLKPQSYFQEMINELLNLRWLFFVFLLLLSLEWFLRKYWGIY
ncbi:MAG TPA: hypothetical protein VJ919_06135 [Tangfeifania sp.]|nr:hypothetical protein [Tangfeifania sp.]